MKLDDIRGLADAHERVQRLFVRLIPLAQEHRFATLPLAAQKFFAAFEWLGEVNNGGAQQYFSNAAGDRWRLALLCLEELEFEAELDVDAAGSTSSTAIAALRTAVAAFPDGAPPENRWDRHEALEAMQTRTGPDSFAHVSEAVSDAVRAGHASTIDALARFIDANAEALRFIDRYPSGLKAIELPDDLTMAQVKDADDPFVVVTGAHHVLQGPNPSGTTGDAEHVRTFLDSYGFLDEVSAGGFAGYFRTAASGRWRETVKALHTTGAPAAASLLQRAAAMRDAADGDLAVLDGEHQDARTALVEALARYVQRAL